MASKAPKASRDVAASPRRRSTDTRDERLEVIAARARTLKTRLDLDVGKLIHQYYADAAIEDLAARDSGALAAAALGHMELGATRRRGEPRIRVFNPTVDRDGWTSAHTIVDVINDDMPFLVDSVSMALNRLGHGIHLTIHPLLRVLRAPAGRLKGLAGNGEAAALVESCIHLEITRETDPEILAEIERTLHAVLGDVRAAVEDWQTMVARLRSASSELRYNAPPHDGILEESCALLDWLADDHFTLLGYREYRLVRGTREDRLEPVPDTGLGILRETGAPATPMVLTSEMRKQARSREALILTKANTRSTVHRPARLDYIGVKVFDDSGRAVAERRFLGLLTSIAYSANPQDIPLVRLKVNKVVQQSGVDPRSHRGKALQHILNDFPREELFQSTIDDLTRISIGILNLQDRQQIKLFMRRDAFRRFYSCLLFVPRDKYNTNVRHKIERILMEDLHGDSVDSQVTLSEAVLARLHIIVRTTAGRQRRINVASVEQHLIDVVHTWADRLRETMVERLPEDVGLKLHRRFAPSFPAAYQEDVSPHQASYDIQRLAELADGTVDLQLSLYRPPDAAANHLRFKVFCREAPLPLSQVLPMLENMGLDVISERPYRLRGTGAEALWIQDFELAIRGGAELDPTALAQRFQDCFRRTLNGAAEDDGFNSFLLAAPIDWRDAALLRAYCKYLVQTGMPYSQAYMQEVLGRHPGLYGNLIQLFKARFDPDMQPAARKHQDARATKQLGLLLEAVSNLDEDRILRAFIAVVKATLRTNFFQAGPDGEPKPYFSCKLDPAHIPELPPPRPTFEIFVYSPRVEGVHLRGGPIARGGLRWSDRREDFRTEVLGLMKAQQVKNAVIVPNGAKGGFVCKQLPEAGGEALQQEVQSCYRTFIRGLLDVTDNIVSGEVQTPPRVRCRDGHDPYLVVAADKGTATFSDMANQVAAEYDFWLGDAFASGGSAGYDHKKMGITARGAWEAVKRHFRELGLDIQAQDFTVAGIGDMSGDVFGNGMLLSPHIRLQAAFNHQHIFLDPDPDPAVSFKERQRLFALPRSGWDDYDPESLSAGGGVYSRQVKSIRLHPDAQAMLGLAEEAATPPEIVRAILRMEVDLLWNGGIGTYVKSRREADADAGDRANDNVRVNGSELRCKVIGEGGNLGLTQRARIEYALVGGRLNTDFIDNSAGVDCSDREVNLKILLNQALAEGALTRKRRDKLLQDMTDAVAEQVLRNNYLQTQAISAVESRVKERFNENARLIRVLEASGRLDRTLEFLPTEDELEERRKAGQGLSRPEIAVVLSYSKIALYQSLIDSELPEDPFLAGELESYFPAPVRKRFAALIPEHRLRHQIVAMLISSSLINRMGPAFALRAEEETGASAAQVARAYTLARDIFDVRTLWSGIEALDNVVQAEVQYTLMFQISRFLRRVVYWILQHHPGDLDIADMAGRLKPGVSALLSHLGTILGGSAQRRRQSDVDQYVALGVPGRLATGMANLSVMTAVLDIVEVAAAFDLEPVEVGRLYFELGRGLKLDWIREQIESLRAVGRWQALARATLRETLNEEHRSILRQLLAQRGDAAPPDTLADWLAENRTQIHRARQALRDMETAGERDFAALSVALNEIRRLSATRA